MQIHNIQDSTLKIDKLIDSHKQQIETLENLKASLTHEQQDVVDPAAKEISLNQLDLRILKNLVARAQDEGRDKIEFKGNIMLTDYAAYVVEYVSDQFDNARR